MVVPKSQVKVSAEHMCIGLAAVLKLEFMSSVNYENESF